MERLSALTIGDVALQRIKTGKNWYVHSVFARSLNLANNKGELLTLASEDYDAGPFIIGVPQFEPRRMHLSKELDVSVQERNIVLGEFEIELDIAQIYDSAISKNEVEKWISGAKVAKLLELVKQELLSSDYSRFYRYVFFPRISAFPQNLDKVLGFGYGTTPSGDDFIAGWLLASFFFSSPLQHKKLAQSVIKILDRTNEISANYIILAAQGRVNKKIKKSLEKLFLTNKIETLNEGGRFGYTSEYDFLLGFTSALV